MGTLDSLRWGRRSNTLWACFTVMRLGWTLRWVSSISEGNLVAGDGLGRTVGVYIGNCSFEKDRKRTFLDVFEWNSYAWKFDFSQV